MTRYPAAVLRRVLSRKRVGIGFLGLALLLATAFLLLPPAWTGPAPARLAGKALPLFLAHRGGAGEAPENTLGAFARLWETRPDVLVELDVRMSRDGHAIVMHDARIDRTTRGSGRVADLTLAELREAVGNLTTLDDVLRALPPDAAISIEVKTAGLEGRVTEAVRAAGVERRLLVGSRHDAVARRLKTLLPEASHYFPARAGACLVMAAKLGFGSGLCDRYDVLAMPRKAMNVDLTTPAFIAELHARGIAAFYFTVDDTDTINELLRRGADGIFTDHPARLPSVVYLNAMPSSAATVANFSSAVHNATRSTMADASR